MMSRKRITEALQEAVADLPTIPRDTPAPPTRKCPGCDKPMRAYTTTDWSPAMGVAAVPTRHWICCVGRLEEAL